MNIYGTIESFHCQLRKVKKLMLGFGRLSSAINIYIHFLFVFFYHVKRTFFRCSYSLTAFKYFIRTQTNGPKRIECITFPRKCVISLLLLLLFLLFFLFCLHLFIFQRCLFSYLLSFLFCIQVVNLLELLNVNCER